MPLNQAASESFARPRQSKASEWKRRFLFIGIAAVLLLVIGFAFFVRHFPFSRERVAQSLEEDFDGKVSFQRFRTTYFPHPGCEAEGLTLVNPASPAGIPPLVSAQKFTIRAHYIYLFLKPGYISRIIVEGLHVQIPPRPRGSTSTSQTNQSSSTTRVGEFIANNSLLDIARQRGEPLRFVIHTLTLRNVGRKEAMPYDVSFTNALPPGEIESRGHFGPWNFSDSGQTPVSGTYKFERADLGVFHGVQGTLSSHDNFQGTMRKIETRGTVDIPDFKLVRAAHSVPLHARFHAFVDGFNGDVHLEEVDSLFFHTAIASAGSVAGRPQVRGKTTSLDLEVDEGRIQDLFRMFIKEPRPPFNGATSLRVHVDILPEGRPFLLEVMMNGDFGVAGGRFTKSDRQVQIAHLSERAQGKKPKPEDDDDDPGRVVSNLSGHVLVKNGVATFTRLSFSIPGALAQLHGTFNLVNEQIDFHGTLKTDASFSQTAGGVKSIFLKPFDVLFKKKPKGAEIPIQLTGTYSDVHPGLDLSGKKK